MCVVVFYTGSDTWYDPEIEHEVKVYFTFNKGCKATWGHSGGSPAEPDTIDIDWKSIIDELGYWPDEKMQEDIEQQVWDWLAEDRR